MNGYKCVLGGTNEYLTDGKTIFWKNVRKLIHYLSSLEEDYFKQEILIRDKNSRQNSNSRQNVNDKPDSPEEKMKKFDLTPTTERSVEKYINPFKSNWQSRYYKVLFNVDIDDERRKQICVNYLEGLEWTMKYYTSGCPDWRWNYKYNYPPLLCDLIHYVPYFDKDFFDNNKIIANPVSDLVQLCYVLPRESLHFLPLKLYERLIKTHGDLYNGDFDFVWSFCRYFWEAHVNLPHIDIDMLEEFIEKNK